MAADLRANARATIEVAAGIVIRHGRVLLAKRRAGSHLAGVWEFPGGKREEGETWEQCLIRELREELGIEVVVERLHWSVAHEYPDRTIHLQFYICHLAGEGEPALIQCDGIAWASREELGDFEFPAADAELVRRMQAEETVWG